MLYGSNTGDCVSRPVQASATGSGSSCCDSFKQQQQQQQSAPNTRHFCDATGNQQQQQQQQQHSNASDFLSGPSNATCPVRIERHSLDDYNEHQTMMMMSAPVIRDHHNQILCEQHQQMGDTNWATTINCADLSNKDDCLRGLKRPSCDAGPPVSQSRSMLVLSSNSTNICLSDNKHQQQNEEEAEEGPEEATTTCYGDGTQRKWLGSMPSRSIPSCSSRSLVGHHKQTAQKCCALSKSDISCDTKQLQELEEEEEEEPQLSGRDKGEGRGGGGGAERPKGNCTSDTGEQLNYRPILAKILNEKKLALISSPEVVRFMGSGTTSKFSCSSSTNKCT